MKLKRTILGPALVAGVAFVSGGWLLQRGVAEQAGLFENSRLFDEVLRAISERYVDVHPNADLYRMAIDGMLRELGDPHTSFMSREEYENLRIQTTGEYGGLGIEIDVRDGWITVVSPLPESPAERAGIRSGDRIVQVEGESTQGWSTQQAVGVLRGPKGQPVNIHIARSGVDEPIPFRIVRDEIQIQSVRAAYMVGDGVGLVALSMFSETSTDELTQAIEQLRGQGMSRLILDLRGNPGGLLDQGISVSDMFLNRGAPISETRSREPRESRTFRAVRGQQFPDIPMVVLVDGSSASASEIVAGALQDNDRALVVGTTSFGKGSVQTLYPLSGGNFLKLTTGRWYTPVGRSIQRDYQRQDGDPMALLEDDEAIAPDGTPVPEANDTTVRRPYRTAGGRTVFGGGGIVPDLVVRPDTVTQAERDFYTAAARAGSAYADVLFRFTVDHVRQNPNLRQDFQVTPAMRNDFFTRLQGANVEVTREQFESARRLIDRDLTFEIAYHKFGRGVAIQRRNQESAVVRTATDLLRASASQQAVFQAAQTRNRAATRS
jgi:carboxyl-terminal processing protease